MYVRGSKVPLYPFLSSILDGGERLASRPCRFNPGKNPGIHWIGGCLGPRAGVDFSELWTPDRPARSIVTIPTELCRLLNMSRNISPSRFFGKTSFRVGKGGRICECRNEPLGSVKCKEYIDQMRNCFQEGLGFQKLVIVAGRN